MDVKHAETRATPLIEVGVFIVAASIVGGLVAYSGEALAWLPLLWAPLIAAVELVPVPAWRGVTISVGFPILVMVAILYPPGLAGLIAFLGASDPRELRREVSLGLALFNRSQVALSVVAASAVYHGVAPADAAPVLQILGAVTAAVADYVVNVSLVTAYMSRKLRITPRSMLHRLTIGSLNDFLFSYLGLGVLGLALAEMFEVVGPWSIPAVLAPLLFARQAFFRAQALEEAHKELKEREQVLRQLSNTIAEERADERLQIAGYLHDDLAQVLFRLSLQVDVARRLLNKRDLAELENQLDKIRGSKQETSDRVRALIRDLHRSPLGAKGLAEALESFTDEVGRDSSVVFHHDIDDIDLPAPITLLIYHIAREGIMNALKHAQARDLWVSVRSSGDDIILQLRDNGVGFDSEAPGPEGHFGMAMMRERAQVGGGSFAVASEVGDGATITVRFPASLLQRDPERDDEPPSANGSGRASRGKRGTTSRAGGGSRGSVPA
ncbi:MAG: sensor histidine kinase [Actinomycetota bacterium]